MNTITIEAKKLNKATGFARGVAVAILVAASLAVRADSESEKKDSEAAAKAAEVAKSAEAEKAKQAEIDKEKQNQSKNSGTDSNVQSGARSYGLDIVGNVKQAGSDDRSKEFQSSALPQLSEKLNEAFGKGWREGTSLGNSDPSKLKLATDSDVRVYFLGEDGKNHNTLGFTVDDAGIKSDAAKIIFPDASAAGNGYKSGNDDVKRTDEEPLKAGDFVNLGQFHAGSNLDFFQIADGANGGKSVGDTGGSATGENGKNIVSWVGSYSSYVLLGFYDNNKESDHYHETSFYAIDITKANLAALTATPEPGTWLTLGSFLGAGVWFAKRRNRA